MSQYIRPKVTIHKGVETIQGRKLFKGGNYMRKYGSFRGNYSRNYGIRQNVLYFVLTWT